MDSPPFPEQEIIVFRNEAQRGELHAARGRIMLANPRAPTPGSEQDNYLAAALPGMHMRRLMIVYIDHHAEPAFPEHCGHTVG
jgi:hypothetical protein